MNVRRLIGPVFNLAAGEAASNFASFLLFAYISRHFGLELLGIVALAQTAARYVTLGTDQGLRLVGARLVARNGGAAPLIIKAVLAKRLMSCAVCIALATIYALCGPVPEASRAYILGFVLGVVPYAFSLDWLAWGRDEFGWLGILRGGVTVVFLIGSISGFVLTRRTLLPLTMSYGVAAASGALAAWIVWHVRWKSKIGAVPEGAVTLVRRELHWFAVLPLGLATILNQAFHNADTLLLGAMSTASEVGRYSSAYRILFLVLGGYWLITNSLYPRLSRAQIGGETEKLLRGGLVAVATAGIILAAIISVCSSLVLRVVYGSDLGAVTLLRVLSFAIPMDFCVALLGTAFVSRGRDGTILFGTGTAAGVNVTANLFLIPRYHAMGAAIATLVSYVYLLAFLLHATIRRPIFAANTSAVTAS